MLKNFRMVANTEIKTKDKETKKQHTERPLRIYVKYYQE